MALKKAGRVGRVPDIGEAPPPMTAVVGPLTVQAQGAVLGGDDRVIITVHVADQKGKPVTGLSTQHFRAWQTGHLFGELNSIWVVELENLPGLEGTYHVVSDHWSLAVNGTVPFLVRVERNAASTGVALTFAVKVQE